MTRNTETDPKKTEYTQAHTKKHHKLSTTQKKTGETDEHTKKDTEY